MNDRNPLRNDPWPSDAPRDRVAALEEQLVTMLTGGAQEITVMLPLSDGRRMAWLHAHGEVIAEADVADGESGPQRRVTVRLNRKELGQFAALSA